MWISDHSRNNLKLHRLGISNEPDPDWTGPKTENRELPSQKPDRFWVFQVRVQSGSVPGSGF